MIKSLHRVQAEIHDDVTKLSLASYLKEEALISDLYSYK